MVFASLFLFLVLGTMSISSLSKVFSKLKKDAEHDKLALWLFDPAGKKNLIYCAVMFIILILSLLTELAGLSLMFTTLVLFGMIITSVVSLIAVNAVSNKFMQYINDLIIATEFIILLVLYVCQLEKMQTISAQIGLYFVFVITVLMAIQLIIFTMISLGSSSMKNYIWRVYHQNKDIKEKPFLINMLFSKNNLEKFDIEFKILNNKKPKENSKAKQQDKAEDIKAEDLKESKDNKNDSNKTKSK